MGRRRCCCKLQGALGPGIVLWFCENQTASNTCPCVVKYSAGGFLQWYQDPGYGPGQVAVDDLSTVYVSAGFVGSTRLQQSTGAIIGGGLLTGHGRTLAHPFNGAGTLPIYHIGPGSSTISAAGFYTGLSQTPSLTSNSIGEYAYNLNGLSPAALGWYTATGARKHGLPQSPGHTYDRVYDAWLADSGDLYVLYSKLGDPGSGWVYKYRGSDGVIDWAVSSGRCINTITGDNNGHIWIGGGGYSLTDLSNIVQLDSTDGSYVWGFFKGIGTSGTVTDLAADSSGNIAAAGASDGLGQNIHYLDVGGTLHWRGNHRPHNPAGGFNSWGVTFDSAGNVYGVGERYCNS